MLEREVYTLFEGRAFRCSKNSTFCGDPCLTMHKVGFYEAEDDIPYDIQVVRDAVKRLYAEYDLLGENPCYRFDLMHLTRQCNADYGWVMVRKMEKAYTEKNLPEFEALSREYLDLIDLQDRLLSNSERTMLGPWLQRAWDTGRTEREKRMFLHAAKDLITLWCGINGKYSLSHYSTREWSGLLGGYHKNCWDAYLSMLMIYIDKPQEIHEIDWTEYSYVFSLSNERYPVTPGNTLREDVERSMEAWK